MIDVLKRLAELDAKNSNVVYETKVSECGPMTMGMPVAEEPKTPATLNITAGDGEELGNMLAAIMQLAGVHKVEPSHLGAEPEPMKLTAEPNLNGASTAGDDMRSVIDKLNPEDEEGEEEETDEGEYDNSPADPTDKPSFEPNEFAQNTNDGDGSDSKGQKRTAFQPTATYESLMAEYQEFISEAKECDVCHKPMKKCECDDE
jgi:hypothetical protein